MNSNFFNNNRQRLAEQLEDNSMVVMFAGTAPYKSADEKYPFTPNRNFYYLTGINEEDVILVMTKVDNKINEMLFINRFDPIKAKWIGAKISAEEAKEVSGVKLTKNLDEFDEYIGQLFNRMGIENVYLDLERQELNISKTQSQEFALKVRERYPYIKINNSYNLVVKLRMIKSEEEIDRIKKAIDITKEGIELMMKNAKPEMKEYEIEAYFDFVLTKNGVKDKAFPTIAAAGKNATILHYGENNCHTKDGDLILFDLGAQYKYYNADISRTFPVNGKFTERQKEVYNVVLSAQKAVEEAAKAGVTLLELNETCKEVLAEGCIRLGLINDKSELGKYYYHGVGHYLGADTHDVGIRGSKLQAGMVITNEPGLYIEEENIGIRIEDDLLITEDGCVNLSKHIIKEADEIENFMKN